MLNTVTNIPPDKTSPPFSRSVLHRVLYALVMNIIRQKREMAGKPLPAKTKRRKKGITQL